MILSQPVGATLLFNDTPVVRTVSVAITRHSLAHPIGCAPYSKSLCPFPPALHRIALYDSGAHPQSLSCSPTRCLALLYHTHSRRLLVARPPARVHARMVPRSPARNGASVSRNRMQRSLPSLIRASAAGMRLIRCEALDHDLRLHKTAS